MLPVTTARCAQTRTLRALLLQIRSIIAKRRRAKRRIYAAAHGSSRRIVVHVMQATTCVYPDALRPQSANERNLDDLCLPSVWLSPSEHSLKGTVRTFPWLFSSDKPFNQNYFTQTQNMHWLWGFLFSDVTYNRIRRLLAPVSFTKNWPLSFCVPACFPVLSSQYHF